MRIFTCVTPMNLEQELLTGATVVVVDALRMTSTAVTAIENGAVGIRPVTELEEARRVAEAEPGALLCGERLGKKLPGFHLGNSPLEYTPERVSGRRLISTTTNGTRVLNMAAAAKKVMIGSFLNAAALAQRLLGAETLVMVCAGNYDRMSLEDVLAVGCILERLRRHEGGCELDDASEAALCLYEQGRGDLLGMLRRSAHCRYLCSLGADAVADVRYCLQEDTHRATPVLSGDWITGFRESARATEENCD